MNNTLNCLNCKHSVVVEDNTYCRKNNANIKINVGSEMKPCPLHKAEKYTEKYDFDKKYGWNYNGEFYPYQDKSVDFGYLEDDDFIGKELDFSKIIVK